MREHRNDTILDKTDGGAYEIISERLYPQRQSWHYKVIVLVDGRKLRVRIERNAYDFQSHAKVELWADDKWQPVTSMTIGECKCAVVSYVTHRDRFDIGLFREDARTLLQEAAQIALGDERPEIAMLEEIRTQSAKAFPGDNPSAWEALMGIQDVFNRHDGITIP